MAAGAAQAARKAAAEKRKFALAEKKREREEAMQKQIDEWFTKYDQDGNGQLSAEEMKQLLTFLHPGHEPNEEQMAMLNKYLGDDKQGDREEVRKVVSKFEAYVELGPQIDEAFAKFDADGSGQLEKEEVKKLVMHLDPKATDGDVDYLYQLCDADGDGALGKVDLLPALGTWKKLMENATFAEPAPAPAPKSSSCVLL